MQTLHIVYSHILFCHVIKSSLQYTMFKQTENPQYRQEFISIAYGASEPLVQVIMNTASKSTNGNQVINTFYNCSTKVAGAYQGGFPGFQETPLDFTRYLKH